MSSSAVLREVAARAGLLGLVASLGCHADELEPIRSLHPDPNPITAADPLFSPQPHRDRPRATCASRDGTKAWVMLAGTEDEPGDSVAVIDLVRLEPMARITLAPSPWDCALDPSGRFLVVTLRYSDHAVVLDAESDQEIARVPVPFYTEHPLFLPSGERLYLTNRWKDSVIAWDLDPGQGFFLTGTSYDGLGPEEPMGTPVAENPSVIALSGDGSRLFVGSATSGTISVLDAATGALIDVDADPRTTTAGAPPGVSHLDFHSPVGGLAASGDLLFIADTGKGTGSHAFHGRDLDDDGEEGDGTANVIFQDLQNEIGVVDTRTLEERWRVTSDSICCQDFRDVDPDRPERGLALPSPDTWGPEVLPFLPPKDRWIVAGSLPEGMVVHEGRLWVAYAGTNEVQSFVIGPEGSLSAEQKAGGLHRTGYNPKAITVAGSRLITTDRLGERITVIDPREAPGNERAVVVGDLSAGPFPSSDVEIGEGINEMTAAFTIDGDQTCVHCHRENGSIARPIVMPLQKDRLWGARNVMAQRGLYDTRPWFFESAMDESNFFPVLNEFARKENFCCEGLDPTVWSHYPTAAECVADPAKSGCEAVLHCEAQPPPECAERPYAEVPFLRRAAFIKDAAKRLFGRDESFGDALAVPLPGGGTKPIPLDFEGITRAIGLFMLRTPRLLPNPNRDLALPTARRGQALFTQPGTGCASCHPLPRTTTATLPTPFSPSGMPVRFPPVISPSRAPDGSDASQVTAGFIGSFPQTVQGPAGLHVGSTPLRGLWDRPQTRFYHDGRARSLREALATPGHDALRPGETGHNERDSTFDTHGGTSQLDRYQLEDLINFLLTL
jgi:WD40 repeat protein